MFDSLVRRDGIALSVVVPAHDEAPNLETLLDEVRRALDPLGLAWELIVVDDGSTDGTWPLLASLAAGDPRLRPLRLPIRRGQTAALVAGFRAATGPLIATLDADIQCSPAELPALLHALAGADLASGVRTARQDPLGRRVVSALANLVRRCVLAPRLRDLACPIRVFRAEALGRVETLTPLIDGTHRWLPALFVLAGLRVVQRPVPHQPRRAGVSKYTATGRAGPIAREAVDVLGIALRSSRRRRVAASVAGLALVALPFLYRLGAWPLTEPDEGRNAEVAREMLELGSWSVPHFNHLPYLDKPVLLFWTMAASFRTIGASEFAARLPSALAAVATVALTFAITRGLLGARRAVVAAAAFATAPLVLAFGRAAIFDMLLTLLVTAALCCLLQARRTGDAWRWWPLAGLSMGLAVLCKGPVGIAVPLLAWIAGRGALPPAPRRAGAAPALVAVALGAAIVLPWLVIVHGYEPGFLRYALVDETLLRLTSTEKFHRGGAPYYYAVVLSWAGGAWGILLLALTPALIRRRREGGADGAAIAFAARAAAVLLLFFTLSASKRPQYILPSLVPLAVLIAAGAAAEPRRVVVTLRLLGGAVALVGIVALVVGLVGFVPIHGPLRAITPTVAIGAGLALAGWGVLTASAARRPPAALACAAILGPLMGLLLLGPISTYVESRSSRALAQHIPARAKVVCLEVFPTSLPFYLRRPIVLVTRNAHELTSQYVMAERERFMGGEYLKPLGRFTELIAGDPDVIVLANRWQQGTLKRLVKDRLVLVHTDRRILLFRPKR